MGVTRSNNFPPLFTRKAPREVSVGQREWNVRDPCIQIAANDYMRITSSIG